MVVCHQGNDRNSNGVAQIKCSEKGERKVRGNLAPSPKKNQTGGQMDLYPMTQLRKIHWIKAASRVSFLGHSQVIVSCNQPMAVEGNRSGTIDLGKSLESPGTSTKVGLVIRIRDNYGAVYCRAYDKNARSFWSRRIQRNGWWGSTGSLTAEPRWLYYTSSGESSDIQRFVQFKTSGTRNTKHRFSKQQVRSSSQNAPEKEGFLMYSL